MKIPEIPEDEESRLEALRALNILDSSPEERFDRITRLAKYLFRVPIALVSLIDQDRQWFKSCQGLSASQTGRDVSFCGHAILTPKLFEIPDATKDERFADNPLVTGPPDIRFYAGMPLSCNEGYRLGTLCIIDTRPRSLNSEEKDSLADLAKMVEAEINHLDIVSYTEELKKAREDAEKANNAKSAFLSSMSHELRTPLNAVLGFGQLLELGSLPDEKRRSAIRQILKAGEHLLDLINDILDLSKIDSGGMELSMEPVLLCPLVDEAINLIVPMANKRGISIINECSNEVVLYADQIRLKQVVLNLLSNAVKYNHPEGGVYISAVNNADETVTMSVRDTGPGISEDKMDDLFEPFNRLDAENSNIEGTGIGLTISKRLVELMGGVLSVESVVSVGTTFSFSLPVTSIMTADELLASTDPIETYDGMHALDQSVVLYIEDNPANLKLITDLLSMDDRVKLHTAHTPELGIELALSVNPDLILLDINMPNLNGFQVLDAFKSEEGLEDVPVFAVTARATDKDIKRGMEAGFSEYVTKPINVRNFLHLVNKYLNE